MPKFKPSQAENPVGLSRPSELLRALCVDHPGPLLLFAGTRPLRSPRVLLAVWIGCLPANLCHLVTYLPVCIRCCSADLFLLPPAVCVEKIHKEQYMNEAFELGLNHI